MTKAFTFLPMPPRSEKPRVRGVTMAIDSGVGIRYLKDLLDICADYVDIWKLGWATTQLQDQSIVQQKVATLKEHGIQVMNGGTLFELAEHQGHGEKLFRELLALGFDATEISSGSLDIPNSRMCEAIKQANDLGLITYCEVGRKRPESDLTAAEYNESLKLFIEAGAHKVIVEARESGVGVGFMQGDGSPDAAMVEEALSDVDTDRVIFEAPQKDQQVFFLRRFGSEANLGNIAPNDIISLETLRRGMRGDTVEDFYHVISARHMKKQRF